MSISADERRKWIEKCNLQKYLFLLNKVRIKGDIKSDPSQNKVRR